MSAATQLPAAPAGRATRIAALRRVPSSLALAPPPPASLATAAAAAPAPPVKRTYESHRQPRRAAASAPVELESTARPSFAAPPAPRAAAKRKRPGAPAVKAVAQLAALFSEVRRAGGECAQPRVPTHTPRPQVDAEPLAEAEEEAPPSAKKPRAAGAPARASGESALAHALCEAPPPAEYEHLRPGYEAYCATFPAGGVAPLAMKEWLALGLHHGGFLEGEAPHLDAKALFEE